MTLSPIPMEEEMRIVSTLAPMVAVAFGVALLAPVSALASDSVHPYPKHAIHQAAYVGVSSTATALAPAPVVPTRETNGLSRNSDDCNRGCIDH
jgi:hypothetical protein